MVSVDIAGKEYFLNFNMLAMMQLEDAFGGDLHGMYEAFETTNGQINNIMTILYIVINSTAEELERDDLKLPSKRWLAAHMDKETMNEVSRSLMTALAMGVATQSNDDVVRDIFLEEDRREDARKNLSRPE